MELSFVILSIKLVYTIHELEKDIKQFYMETVPSVAAINLMPKALFCIIVAIYYRTGVRSKEKSLQ